ncbi:MAG: R3H domain-containing nucleic acid-binding protein [Candidatus Paceibacterota bacterium]|jgi:spoIIIJ-associated protein
MILDQSRFSFKDSIGSEEEKIIENIILDFFDAAGYEAEIQSINLKHEGENNVLRVNLNTGDAQMLIGKQGMVLSDIQLLIRKILKKALNQEIFLNLDIDNYKKKKEEYLRDLAEDIADEAVFTKKIKEIPMPSPFDRRIVHLELSKRDDVVVESVGEGEERHIIVKPKTE